MANEQIKEELLTQLEDLADEIREMTSQRVPLSILARSAGATWGEIGDALGVTAQAAQMAYSRWKAAAYTFPIPDGQDPMFTE